MALQPALQNRLCSHWSECAVTPLRPAYQAVSCPPRMILPQGIFTPDAAAAVGGESAACHTSNSNRTAAAAAAADRMLRRGRTVLASVEADLAHEE